MLDMKRFVSLFFVFVLLFSSFTHLKSEVTSTHVVEKLERISSDFNKIESLSARVRVARMVDYNSWGFEGRYFFVRDVGYRYEFASPLHQVIGYYLDTLYVYSNESDTAFRVPVQSGDKNTQAVVRVFDIMNYDFYAKMRENFTFAFSHEVNGHWVIAVKPKLGWQNLGGIFLKIDPINNVYRVLELYNTKGELFKKVSLNDPVTRGDISVNTQIITTQVIGNSIKSDTVSLSGVRINNVEREIIKPKIAESAKILNTLDYDIFNRER